MSTLTVRLGLCVSMLISIGCGDADTASVEPAGVEIDTNPGGFDPSEFECGPQECLIEGQCTAHMQPSEESPCLICDITTDRLDWTSLTGASCDDGSLCTTADQCYEGACVGDTKVCDDGEQCTDNNCLAETGECDHPTRAGACSDGDDCTLDDSCVEGECQSGPLDACDDGEPCTVGSCSPGTGCAFQAIEVGPCDDGNACTLNETCDAGTCTPESNLDCDDDNVCTADVCDIVEGCLNTPYDKLCDDGDQCTIDECNADIGCTHVLSNGPCDDDDACTEVDTCIDGSCLGTAVAIDDGDPCTDDACDPSTGVSHVNNEAPCDDGDECTAGDTCSEGVCQTGPEPTNCDDGSICTEDSCDSAEGCIYVTVLECNDGNDCTADTCDPVEGCVSDVIETNTCRPQIDISYPPRAATILGDPAAQFVEIQGTATSGAGAITEVTLNGFSIDVAEDGTFSTSIPVFVGGNTFVMTATDSLGTDRKTVQSFHWSPEYYKKTDENPDGAMADPGAAIFLAPEINDKLEEIFESVLGDFDIAQFIPNPVTPEPVTADAGLGNVTYVIYLADCPDGNCCAGDKCYDFFNTDAPSVSVESVEQGLKVQAVIGNISAGIWGNQTGCSWLGCLAPNPLVGTMSIENITIDAMLLLSVDENNELQVELDNAAASFSGVSVDIDHWTAFVIEGIINDQVESLLTDVEAEFAEQIDTILAPLVQESLNALAFEAEFPLPPLFPGGKGATLNLFTDFADVAAGEDGLLFVLRAGSDLLPAAEGEGSPPLAIPETHLGAVRRGGCAIGAAPSIPLLKESPLELVLADDTMNLLLHSAWEAGFLEFPVPAELLADVDLSQYGVSDLVVNLSGMLPPVMSDCTLEELRLNIGDLRIDATLTALGNPVDVVMYLSLTAGFAFNVSDAGLSFGLTELEQFEIEVTVLQDDLIGLEPVVESLVVENLMPQILGNLTTGACEPTSTVCEPGCTGGTVCQVDGSCACQPGTELQEEACVPVEEACTLTCPGTGICVNTAEGEACACQVGFAGKACQDCSPGYSTIGGLAAFPLPEIDLSGDGPLEGVPPIQIVPFQSEHTDGFTIISGDLQ